MSENNVVTKVNTSGIAPTPEQVAKLEASIGHKVPQSYLDLLADLTASVPLYNSFPITKPTGITGLETETIERFYPFTGLERVYHSYTDDHTDLEDFPEPTCNGSSDISGFLPIAKTHNAELCLDVSEHRGTYGAVYCWQVSYDFGLNQFVKLADTLPQFMQSVKNTEISEEEYAKCEFGHVVLSSAEERAAMIAKVRAKHGLK